MDVLAVLTRDPSSTGLFTDFDGTLSAIVPDPAAAVPVPGAVEALEALGRRYAAVGVFSGRPVDFIARFFPADVTLAGLYGLETRVGGARADHPEGDAWRQVVADVVAAAAVDGPAGMRVESKGLSLTLHYRGAPELAEPVEAWARAQAAASGLEVRAAKMSVELHPPIEEDKGTTLLRLAAGLATVAFFGDDVGDLPAFDALDQLAAQGVTTVRVVARSTEVDPAMLARADLVVDGPDGILELFDELRRATA